MEIEVDAGGGDEEERGAACPGLRHGRGGVVGGGADCDALGGEGGETRVGWGGGSGEDEVGGGDEVVSEEGAEGGAA